MQFRIFCRTFESSINQKLCKMLYILDSFKLIGGGLEFDAETENRELHKVFITEEDFNAYLGSEINFSMIDWDSDETDWQCHAQCIYEAYITGRTSYDVTTKKQTIKKYEFKKVNGGINTFCKNHIDRNFGSVKNFMSKNNYKSFAPVWG